MISFLFTGLSALAENNCPKLGGNFTNCVHVDGELTAGDRETTRKLYEKYKYYVEIEDAGEGIYNFTSSIKFFVWHKILETQMFLGEQRFQQIHDPRPTKRNPENKILNNSCDGESYSEVLEWTNLYKYSEEYQVLRESNQFTKMVWSKQGENLILESWSGPSVDSMTIYRGKMTCYKDQSGW